jgi:hypothetical protein
VGAASGRAGADRAGGREAEAGGRARDFDAPRGRDFDALGGRGRDADARGERERADVDSSARA